MLKRQGLVLATLLLCASCGSVQRKIDQAVASHLAADATAYNLAIEQAQNENLLLNVIRSMNYSPLYITDIIHVSGSVKADLNLGLKVPLVHLNKSNDLVASPTFDFATSPSMDINVLSAQDFMTGFLSEIAPDVFAYYWNQGWPAEMLLLLFVGRIENVDCKPKETCVWLNYPNVHDASLRDLRAFSKKVDELLMDGRPLMDRLPDEKVGPAIQCPPSGPSGLDSFRAIADDDKVTLSLDDSKLCQLTRRSKAYVLHRPGATGGRSASRLTAMDIEGRNYALTLRSPEGILYYLGELARIATQRQCILMIHPCDPTQCADAPMEPLFVVSEGKSRQCEDHVRTRGPDGTEYFVPREGKTNRLSGKNHSTDHLAELDDVLEGCWSGRSMHSLTLLSQLISLQKAAKDLATTSTVRVVGQ